MSNDDVTAALQALVDEHGQRAVLLAAHDLLSTVKKGDRVRMDTAWGPAEGTVVIVALAPMAEVAVDGEDERTVVRQSRLEAAEIASR